MKKIIALILTLCLAVMCGCDVENKTVSLGGTMEIPDDGIVKESVFKTLRDENLVITFTGKSGDTAYEWTVFGSDITEPRDVNLQLNVMQDTENALSFSLCSEEPLGFTPVLSLHPCAEWDAERAVAYAGGSTEPLCSVSVTGDKNTVLNFSVTQIGEYLIAAEPVEEAAPVPQAESETAAVPMQTDEYLTESAGTGGRRVSDGSQTGQDEYLTDPVPEGMPLPSEPEDREIDSSVTYTCTFSIECSTILNNLQDLDEAKFDVLPTDGVILYPVTVTFYEGESVFDVLQRVCNENGIHMEASWTPIYNSAYVEGIHNLYEFDCGTGSGWMYRVNGWYPNYGCSRYQLEQGDNVEWRYTCDLGADVGGGYAMGG